MASVVTAITDCTSGGSCQAGRCHLEAVTASGGLACGGYAMHVVVTPASGCDPGSEASELGELNAAPGPKLGVKGWWETLELETGGHSRNSSSSRKQPQHNIVNRL